MYPFSKDLYVLSFTSSKVFVFSSSFCLSTADSIVVVGVIIGNAAATSGLIPSFKTTSFCLYEICLDWTFGNVSELGIILVLNGISSIGLSTNSVVPT